MKTFHPKYGWIHILTPEEKIDIENWMPSPEQAKHYFKELFSVDILITNKFGTGKLYEIEEVEGTIYCVCTACTSVMAEFDSWAQSNDDRMTLVPAIADNIIVLSCQVTDLAILNDLRTLEWLQNSYPNKTFYVGGCLAKRFDVELPAGVRRLNNVVDQDNRIYYLSNSMVDYAKPFWVGEDKTAGTLFRESRGIRIGAGCNKGCAYCTIKHTRGAHYELPVDGSLLSSIEPNLLISDSPTAKQISGWISEALKKNVVLSIRNIEPQEAEEVWSDIKELDAQNLLDTFHCPVQSGSYAVLGSMKRNINSTCFILSNIHNLKAKKATNIIVDYPGYSNDWTDQVYKLFDYVSWNPYWDGKWDRALAERRWRRYFGA
jgi:tRNA A37 methylthiotransferase MiaB